MEKPVMFITTSVGRFKTVAILLAVMGSAVFLPECDSSPPSFRGSVYDAPIMAPDFTLTDQYGKPFTLSHHRGKVILIFFGYVYCPDVCPMTLATWKKVQDGLKNKADNVEFVFVTVDPERDTPEKLRKHLSIFSPDFVGLTGRLDELESVYQSYGVYRVKEKISDNSTGYLVGHSAWIFVIDRRGRWRLGHLYDAQVEDILHDVRQLLKE